MSKAVLSLRWTLMVAATAPCIMGACGPRQTDHLSFLVVTFNVEDVPETKEETRVRMRTLAHGLSANVSAGGLVGIQESRYVNVWTGIPDLSTAFSETEEIDCPAGSLKSGAACLAYYYDPSATVHTFRSNAVFASELWEVVHGMNFDIENTSDVPIGGLARSMTGARIRHKASGVIIPFYSVHMSTNNAPHERKEKQLRRILGNVSTVALEHPGDLPAIIVGDFNCGGEGNKGWSRGLREIIYTGFYEASGQPSIDLVFVQRPNMRNTGPGGAVVPVGPVILPMKPVVEGHRVSGRFDPGDLSDHFATWVELQWRLAPRPEDTVPPYVDHNGRGCVPIP